MKALTILKNGTTYQVEHEGDDIVLTDVSTPESDDVRIIKDGYYDLEQEAISAWIQEYGSEDYDGRMVSYYAMENMAEAAERLFDSAIRVKESSPFHQSIAA